MFKTFKFIANDVNFSLSLIFYPEINLINSSHSIFFQSFGQTNICEYNNIYK